MKGNLRKTDMKGTLWVIFAILVTPPVIIAFAMYIAWWGNLMMKLIN